MPIPPGADEMDAKAARSARRPGSIRCPSEPFGEDPYMLSARFQPLIRLGPLALLALCCVACEERARPTLGPLNGPEGSWHQWRGPQRDGTAFSSQPEDAWSFGTPQVLWRRPLGEGLGGIAIDDGKALVLAAKSGEEFLIALDAASGDELWRIALGPTFLDGHGNGPRTTPLIADGRVYAHASRQLIAADLTGRLLWQQPLAVPPEWGFSASPLLVDGHLVVHSHLATEQAGGASIWAFDPTSGEVVWSNGSGHPGYASPMAAELAGKRQVISFLGQALVGLDPVDGRRLWNHPWTTSYSVNAADPIVLPEDRLFISSGYQSGAALLQVSVDGEGTWQVEEIWRSRSMQNHFSSSVRVGDLLFGFDNATFKCISLLDGQTLWRQRGFGRGSLVATDGGLAVLTEDGVLVLVAPDRDGYRELARLEILQGDVWTPPSLAGQWLYARDHHDIVCLNLAG